MKTINISILLGVFALVFSSCNAIDYEEDFSKDGFYNSPQQIYFLTKANQKAINYSFGAKPISYTEHKLEVPLRITGQKATKPLQFKLSINKEKTTAVEGEHYKAFPMQADVKVDSVNAYLPITLLRNKLSAEKNDSIKLVLRLEATKDLAVNFSAEREIVINFDNVLSRPAVWDYFGGVGLGPYTRVKYLKFLEYYDGDEAKWAADIWQTNFFINAWKMYKYFEAHPEEKQEFDKATLIQYVPYL